MGERAFDAMTFAREVHKDQVRKYTGNPYADHLAEVAGLARKPCPSCTGWGFSSQPSWAPGPR